MSSRVRRIGAWCKSNATILRPSIQKHMIRIHLIAKAFKNHISIVTNNSKPTSPSIRRFSIWGQFNTTIFRSTI
ncbi:MAG: hypothetical protein JW739_02270 [Opitutales bacterium]|nr:hypothetical protein [Opitutales bacterium]